jgi:hypothetical protein
LDGCIRGCIGGWKESYETMTIYVLIDDPPSQDYGDTEIVSAYRRLSSAKKQMKKLQLADAYRWQYLAIRQVTMDD